MGNAQATKDLSGNPLPPPQQPITQQPLPSTQASPTTQIIPPTEPIIPPTASQSPSTPRTYTIKCADNTRPVIEGFESMTNNNLMWLILVLILIFIYYKYYC